MDIDTCLDKVGGYRRYSLAAFFVIGCSVTFTLASQIFLFVFVGRTPTHHCMLPEGAVVNESIPFNVKTGALDTCSMYAGNGTNITVPCDNGRTFINPDGDFTIVNEWDLVCERSILPETSMMVFGIGGMVGEGLGNIISDKCGRMGVQITGFVVIIITGIATYFIQSFTAYTTLIFFRAMANSACAAAAFTLLFELFDSKRRAFVGMGIEFLWVLGYLYVGLMGYFVRNWRHLQLILSLTAVSGLFNLLFPESPMWLLANHKIKRANAALRQIAKWNGVPIEGPLLTPEKEMDPLVKDHKKEENDVEKRPLGKEDNNKRGKSPPEETGQENLFDLFRWPLIFKFTVISSLLWFANSLVYYFMILSTPSLAGDFYVNFFVGCLVEIPAYTVAIVVIKYGRRIPTVVFLLSASVAMTALAFIPQRENLTYVIMAVAMWGKFSITTSFAVIVLYTREIFPTNLRATSFGVANLLGRIGMLVAPLALYAAKSLPWLPNLLLGLISLFVALVCLLLPETKDWPLPMSIADVYRYTRGDIPSKTQKPKPEVT